MKKCKFCREPLEDGAKKCKTCGEPFDVVGKLLKFTPLASILIAVIPFAIAFIEIIEKQKATRRAEVAEKAHIAVSRELNAKERAADMALSEIARKLPNESRNEIIKDLRLPSRVTLKQLEQEAKTTPENSDVHKNLYLFRALKKPGEQ
jgi:hypothetical protein